MTKLEAKKVIDGYLWRILVCQNLTDFPLLTEQLISFMYSRGYTHDNETIANNEIKGTMNNQFNKVSENIVKKEILENVRILKEVGDMLFSLIDVSILPG